MSDNPSRVTFSFHLGAPGIMTADKQFSLYVARTLDYLGKNQDMVKYRKKIYREYQEHAIIICSLVENIIAGSKAEGLTSIYESDIDVMIVLRDVICADNVKPFIHNRYTTVFQTDRYDTPAGYTKLKLVKYEGRMSSFEINYSLLDNESEDKYLSSDLFVRNIARRNILGNNTGYINLLERSGPSLPITDSEGYIHEDKVFALRCVCPTIIQSFLTRSRPNNRPSGNELRDISVMDAHVVPVGYNESDNSHLEWRICFTKAEIYLVHKLNETESKLYIILKMVSKLFQFISKDITSYVMKNIVLWLVELYPADLFTEDLLTYQLIQALRLLQKCVEANYLPSYMIPERNLFADRLNPAQILQLTTFMSTLIQEKGYLLLRCARLRNGIMILYREPEMAENFRKRRDMVEKLWLLFCIIKFEKMASTGLSEEDVKRLLETDGTNKKILVLLTMVLCPKWMFLMRQGYSAKVVAKLCHERRIQLLS